MTLGRPEVAWQDGDLVSTRFGDIYFQPGHGLDEARHVFVDGNDLGDHFAALGGPAPFVIGELGFGTGLNFLAAAERFLARAPSSARLDYWTAEGFPFPRDAFRRILATHAERWPSLRAVADGLEAAYPEPVPGQVQCRPHPRVTLTFAFGEIGDVLSRARFGADAWFLDGFSPRTNPEMWTDDVLAAACARTRKGGTVATFTVAGTVRRGLESAGFTLARRPGFGRKREMLTGRMEVGATTRPAPFPRRVAVIGAGIAGACAAFAARQAGAAVTIFDPSPASGASGNMAGLLTPRPEANDTATARFYRDAFLYARDFYGAQAPDAVRTVGGRKAGEVTRNRKIAATGLWPSGDVRIDGDVIDMPSAATLDPAAAISALLDDIQVRHEAVVRLTEEGVETEIGHHDADTVIVTAGTGAGAFGSLADDISGSRGQIDVFDGPVPDAIVSEGAYAAPWNDHLLTGATYDRAALAAEVAADDDSTTRNRRAAEELLGQSVGEPVARRASVRTVTADRHPIVGRLMGTDHSAAFVVAGLGSRGLSTAPILARHIVAELTGSVSPLEIGSAAALRPGRFAERRARKSG